MTDEHLQIYLFANISKQKSGTGDEVREAIASFYNQLEITIDATITDNMPTPSLQRSSSINTQSAPTSPKISYQRRSQMNDVTTPFFTQAYNKSSSKHGELSVFEYNDSVCYLYPMVVPIGNSRVVIKYSDSLLSSIRKDKIIQSPLINQLQHSLSTDYTKAKGSARK